MVVADRYAKALFDIAREEGGVLEVGSELRMLKEVLESLPALRTFLCGPIYDLKDKKETIDILCSNLNLSKVTANFLILLIRKNRMKNFFDILRAYERLEDREAGRERVTITLPATDTESSLIRKVKDRLEEITGKEIVISIKADPSIIGGIMVQMGDIVMDGSVRAKLLKIKERIQEGAL